MVSDWSAYAQKAGALFEKHDVIYVTAVARFMGLERFIDTEQSELSRRGVRLLVVPKSTVAAVEAKHLNAHWGSTTATMAMIAHRISGVPWNLLPTAGTYPEDNLARRKDSQSAFC